MLGELSLEGVCPPSPEEGPSSSKPPSSKPETSSSSPTALASEDADGLSFLNGHPPKKTQRVQPAASEESLEAALHRERQATARLRTELERERKANDQWREAASALVNVLLMSPRQNENYAGEVRKQFEKSLSSLSVVERLRYVNCSFPASKAHAPSVKLLRWRALDDSEWELDWKPAWSCEVVVDGRQVISFSTLLRVSGLRIAGRLNLGFSADLSRLSIRFAETPACHVDVTCKVIIGKVPLPIQETMGNLVRDGALKWIDENLVAPNEITITLNERKSEVSDDEYQQAKNAAIMGAARARDANAWGRSVSR